MLPVYFVKAKAGRALGRRDFRRLRPLVFLWEGQIHIDTWSSQYRNGISESRRVYFRISRSPHLHA